MADEHGTVAVKEGLRHAPHAPGDPSPPPSWEGVISYPTCLRSCIAQRMETCASHHIRALPS